MQVDTIIGTKGQDVVTARPDELVAQAATKLEGHGIGALVIIDDNGAPVGMLSERDIARGITKYGPRLPDTPIANLMSADLVTCGPDDTIAKLMTVMTERRVRHLPVIRDGKLAGLISIGDVVKMRLSEIEEEAEALRAYIAGN